MSSPLTLQNNFSFGIKRDISRMDLPGGSLYVCKDMIPDHLGAPLRKRGDWTTFANVNAADGTVTSSKGMAFAPGFPAGSKLVFVSQNSKLFKINESTGAVTSIGTLNGYPRQKPIYYRGRIILTAGLSQTEKFWDNTTLSAGPGIQALYSAAYKDHLVLANTAAQPQRVYFASAGDPTVFPSSSYIDVGYPVKGLASLQGGLLIFTDMGTELLRGNDPPPDSDFVIDHKWDAGCLDALSISFQDDKVYWADDSGVYMSDGAAINNLAEEGDIITYYQSLVAGYDSSTWWVAGEFFREFYILSISTGSALQDCLVCHVPTRSWFQFTNMVPYMWGKASGTQERLFYAPGNSGQLREATSFFSLSSATGTDGNGTQIKPVIETGFYHGQPGTKQWIRLYLEHLLLGSGGSTPHWNVGIIKSPELTSYTTLPDFFPTTTALARAHLSLGFSSPGFALQLSQNNVVCPDARIYSIQADMVPREGNV